MLELISAAISLGAVLVLILAAALGISVLVLACMVALIVATGRDGKPSLVRRLARLCRRVWRLAGGGAHKVATATRTTVASAPDGTKARAVPKPDVIRAPAPGGRVGPRGSTVIQRVTVPTQAKEPTPAKEPVRAKESTQARKTAAAAPEHAADPAPAAVPILPIRVQASRRTGVGPAPRNPSIPLHVEPDQGAELAPEQVAKVRVAPKTVDQDQTIEMPTVSAKAVNGAVNGSATGARDGDGHSDKAARTSARERKAKPVRPVTNGKPA